MTQPRPPGSRANPLPRLIGKLGSDCAYFKVGIHTDEQGVDAAEKSGQWKERWGGCGFRC